MAVLGVWRWALQPLSPVLAARQRGPLPSILTLAATPPASNTLKLNVASNTNRALHAQFDSFVYYKLTWVI